MLAELTSIQVNSVLSIIVCGHHNGMQLQSGVTSGEQNNGTSPGTSEHKYNFTNYIVFILIPLTAETSNTLKDVIHWLSSTVDI